MSIDVDTPHGKWLLRTVQELHDRRTGRQGGRKWNTSALTNPVERPPLTLLHDYFTGNVPLRKDIHSGWKPYVRAYLRAGRYLIAEKTVTSTTNRMNLRAFTTAATTDEMGDQLANDVMLANEFELLTAEVHDLMGEFGDAYTITQPSQPSDGDRYGRTTAEDPRQCITAHDPVTGRIMAGVKLYRDDWDAADFAHFALRLEDGTVVVQKFRHEGRSVITDGLLRFDPEAWDTDGPEVDNGKIMPFERFRNRFGVAEFERHLDTLDRINDKIFNEWWTTKIQAFRQRAVKGLPDTERRVNTETGKVEEREIDYTDMFTASPDEMWRVPADVDFWESVPVDITPITNGVQKDLERYCAAVDIPLHIMAPEAAQGSAEGATLMREEHVFKIEDRIKRVDRRWCNVMSKHFAYMGETQRADVGKIRGHWGPTERHSLEQQASAASQMRGVYPQEAIWIKALQHAPADIPGLRVQMGRERLFAAAGAPAPTLPSLAPTFTPPTPPTPPGPPAPES